MNRTFHRYTNCLFTIAIFLFHIPGFSQKDTIASQKGMADTSNGDIICGSPSFKHAEFPGGQDSMKAFLGRNVKWPSPDWCGQGTVFIKFKIDTAGAVKDIKLMKSLCTKCDSEALRVVALMPKWTPCQNELGKNVESTYVIPIKFRMN